MGRLKTLGASSKQIRKIVLQQSASILKTQEVLGACIANTNPGLPLASKNTIVERYEAETASSAVTGNAVSTVVRSMVSDGFRTYRFTLLPSYICIPILLSFAVLIPVLCFRDLEK